MAENKFLNQCKFIRRKLNNYRSGIFLIIIPLLSAMMFISSPPTAGPDEARHQATAWFTTTHLLPPQSDISKIKLIPSSIVIDPCYSFKPTVTAKCQIPPGQRKVSEFPVFNYPPLSYWIIGISQRIGSIASPAQIEYFGRFGMLVACMIILYVAYRRLTNIVDKITASRILLLILTPMFSFLTATANPSALEIAATIWFTVESLIFIKFTGSQAHRFNKLLIASAMLVSASRTISYIWVILISIWLFILYKEKLIFKQIVIFLVSIIPGILMGIVWQLTHPVNFQLPSPYTPPADVGSIHRYVTDWIHSIFSFSEKVQQSWGVLGWLDTRAHAWIFGFVLFFWAYFIVYIFSLEKNKVRITVLALSVVLIPTLIEAARWSYWPNWWQGRYQLPEFVAFVIILLVRNHKEIKFSIITTVVVATDLYMTLLNFFRYSFGIANGLPLTLEHPAFGLIRVLGFTLLFMLATYLWLIVTRGDMVKTSPKNIKRLR